MRETRPRMLRPYICLLLNTGDAELVQQQAVIWAGAQIYWAVDRAVTQGCITLICLVSLWSSRSPLGDQWSGILSASQPFIHSDLNIKVCKEVRFTWKSLATWALKRLFNIVSRL